MREFNNKAKYSSASGQVVRLPTTGEFYIDSTLQKIGPTDYSSWFYRKKVTFDNTQDAS